MALVDSGAHQSGLREAIERLVVTGQQLNPKPIALGLPRAVPFVILTDADGAQRVEFLDDYEQLPATKILTVRCFDATSFVKYVQKHAEDATTIYCTLDPARFVAVIDDHTRETTAYRDHRCVYEPALSEEWVAWLGHNGREQPFVGGAEFAEWIEDRKRDFLRPDAAWMMQMALNFKVDTKRAYSAAQRLQDGNIEFAYSSTVDGSSTVNAGVVKIPEEFTVSIPVYEGRDAMYTQMEARFRYRQTNGNLQLWYQLYNPEKVLRLALYTELDFIGRELARDVLFAAP